MSPPLPLSISKRGSDRGGGKHAHSSLDLDEADEISYASEGIGDIARSRTGWLCVFCVGLLLAAVVVEQYEDVLERHVELSFFVPLSESAPLSLAAAALPTAMSFLLLLLLLLLLLGSS
jgi:hypothetical protein